MVENIFNALEFALILVGVLAVGRYYMDGPYEETWYCSICGNWLWKSDDPNLEDHESKRYRKDARCLCGVWKECSCCRFAHHPQEKFCHSNGDAITTSPSI